MENLKSVLVVLINQSKPYWINAAVFIAGLVIGLLL